MVAFSDKIVQGGYRLICNPINSISLLCFSVLFQVFAIMTIIEPLSTSITDSMSLNSIIAQTIRKYLYFYFVKIQNSALNIFALISIGLIQFVFLALICKKQISEASRFFINVLLLIKNTFSLPVSAILVCNIIGNSPAIEKLYSVVIYLISSSTEYLSNYLKFVCICNNSCKSDKYFDWLEPLAKLVLKLILLYTICRDPVTLQERVVISVLIVGLHLALIIKLIDDKIQRYYSVLEAAHYFSWVVVTCYYLVVILELAVELVQDNRWLMLGSLVVWSTLSVHNVLEHSKNELLIKPVDKIATEKQAIAYMRLLSKVFDKKKEKGSSLIFLGLVKAHINDCLDLHCICKSSKNLSSQQTSNGFHANFLQMNFKILTDRFQTQQTKILFLAFQVVVMRKYPMYFYESDLYRKQQYVAKLTLDQKCSLLQIYNEALKQVNQKSRIQQISNQRNRQMFNDQSKIDQCYIKMEGIVSSFATLFIKNARSHCSLSSLKKALSQIYKGLIEIRSLFGDEKLEETISLKLALLMLFFYRGVFNFTFYVKPILKRLQALYRHTEIRRASHQNFDISLFSQNGCVIQSTLQSNVFGLINRVSSNTIQVFKYPSIDSMVNLDIGRLLPRCIRQQHRRIIEKWVEVGSYKNINRLIQTFCIDYTDNVCKVLIRAQIAVIDSKVSIFMGIIKLDDKSFMIVNKKGEIDSFGSDFKEILEKRGTMIKISRIFPQWQAITQNLTKQPVTLRTPIAYTHEQQILNTSREQSPEKQGSDESAHKLPIQLYRSGLRSQTFIVVKKIKDYRSVSLSNEHKLMVNTINTNQHQPQNISTIKSDESIQKEQKQNEKTKLLYEIGSMSNSSNQTYFSIWRVIQQISKRATSKETKYPFLIYITIALAAFFIVNIMLLTGQLYVQINSLNSVEQLINADITTSGNIQLLQILYNNALIYKQNCDQLQSQSCKSFIELAKHAQNLLTQELLNHFKYQQLQRTFFNNKLYQYQLTQVNLTLNGGKNIVVDALTFMQYFIRNSKFLINYSSQNKSEAQYNQTLDISRLNWQQLKKLGSLNAKFFQNIGMKQLKTWVDYIIFCSIITCLLFTGYTMTQYYYYRNQTEFQNKILALFRRIPQNISQKLVQYYTALHGVIKQKDISVLATIQLPKQSQNQYLNQNDFKKASNKHILLQLAIVWLFSISLCAFTVFKVIQDQDVWKHELNAIGDLITSQNYIIQNYCQTRQIMIFRNDSQLWKYQFYLGFLCIDQIDRYLVYTFKMFRITENYMVDNFRIIASSKVLLIKFLMILEMCLQAFLMIYWLCGLKSKRRKLAENYGYVLAFPTALIKQSKFIQQYIGRLL